jgi:hypothetical protein
VRKRKPEDTLDEYLNERTIPDDPELASLARMADRLEQGLSVGPPEARRERALFIQGVAARQRGFPWTRLMVPLTAASMLVAFIAISREAGPGDSLYGVRKALSRVGVAENPSRSARTLLDEAEANVVEAETLEEAANYAAAEVALTDALVRLNEAEELLEDGTGELAEEQQERLADLWEDVRDTQEEIFEARATEEAEERREEAAERAEERREEQQERNEDRSDNSGKGSDDSGGDDNSGSGSGDDAEDRRDDEADRLEEQREEEQDRLEEQQDNSGGGDSGGSSGSGGSGSDDSSGSGDGDGDSSGSGSG